MCEVAVTYEDLVIATGSMLGDLVSRVKRRRPTALGGACADWTTFDGSAQPYASFAAAPHADEIALCICLRRQGRGLACTADLVGEGGVVLTEMPAVSIDDISDTAEAAALIDTVRVYVLGQEDADLDALQEDNSREEDDVAP